MIIIITAHIAATFASSLEEQDGQEKTENERSKVKTDEWFRA